jgi:hypothetical protein
LSGFKHLRALAPRRFSAAAALCLILLVLLAVVQVAHVHAQATDEDNCPLCLALHSAAPVVAAVAAIILIPLGTPAPVVKRRVAVRRPWHPTLFTRPPPTV